jgi:sensor histidine kinase YesM
MNANTGIKITICGIGIMVFLIHIVNLIIKRNKRNDEKWLLVFMIFNVFHFSIYLIFNLLRYKYTSNSIIMSFYTIFYIMNNIEVYLLFKYTLSYVSLANQIKKKLSITNFLIFIIFVISDLVNINTGFYFYAENGEYVRNKFMILSQGYEFIIFLIIILVAFLNPKLKKREKAAFITYCLLPVLGILFQNVYSGYAIGYVSIIITVEILFFFANVEKNIELAKQEEKNKEAHVKLMISQIQPHFIYNSLSAISTLISINPDEAQKSLDNFTEYLRRNLSSLTETRLIPFENELKHIETYVSLEKMRFKDRINIIYDIGTKDFFVPPLTIQPIVENAIKHGILKKIKGGTVTLTTYETDSSYVIEIKDDGIGFNLNEIDFDENTHFGLKNISYRISHTCEGDLNIISKKNEGTKITVTLKK